MSPMYEFVIINTRVKQLTLLSNILLAVNGLLFLFFATQLANTQWAFITAAIGLGIAIFNIIFKKNNSILNNIALIIIASGWIKLGYWWIAVVLILLDMLAKKAIKNTTIIFNNQHVHLNKPLATTYDWQEFQNIVLKDGLLTLDFNNNKLLQVNIANEINEPYQVEFNDFCRKLITTNAINK